MIRSDDFALAVRRGRRRATGTVVAHWHPGGVDGVPIVGFVVSRAVGGSVDRNRVKRRLRHALRAHLGSLPAGRLVLRATPAAGISSWQRLSEDVDVALGRLGIATSEAGRQQAAGSVPPLSRPSQPEARA